MQRNEGVHLHTVEKDLDHDETGSFECECSALAEEANELKLNFTIGRCFFFFWLVHVDGKSKRIDGWLWENTGNSDDLPRKQPQEISCFRNKQKKKVPSAIIPHDRIKGGGKKKTLTKTMIINLPFGSWILNAKEIKRIATGLKALSIWIKETLRVR